MSICLVAGAGDVVDLALQHIVENNVRVNVLTNVLATRDRWLPQLPITPFRTADAENFFRFLEAQSIREVCFVGNFYLPNAIPKSTTDMTLEVSGSVGPGQILVALLQRIKKARVRVRSVREIVPTFQPLHENLVCEYGSPTVMQGLYARSKEMLEEQLENNDFGLSSACIRGIGGDNLPPKNLHLTDEIIAEFKASDLPRNQDYFLCRHNPWPHAPLLPATIGVKTIELAADAGLRGVLATRSQVVVVQATQVAERARQLGLHLQYF